MGVTSGSEAWVPEQAYLAADTAFDDEELGQEDELHRALSAASPYIRMDEVDRHLMALRSMTSVSEAIRYLESQRGLIAMLAG